MRETEESETSLRAPDPEVVQAVMQVYERGQTVDALRRAESFAPLCRWSGANACVLAARIATNAGAPRLGARLSRRALRSDPDDTGALAQYGYVILERRGALALWQLLRSAVTDRLNATDEQRAELLVLRGFAASDLRDFGAAEKALAQAEALAPKRPWVRLARASLLEQLDRVEEALEVSNAARGLHAHPFYRPAVQRSAHLLQLLDRDEDAIRLLQDADRVLQSGPLAAQLYALLSENGRWPEAEGALERYLTLSPLLESRLRNWATAQRSLVLYHRGRRTEAAYCAASVDDNFHRAFAVKLAAPPAQAERVQLNVSFVRQHFKTCAPATLAALGRYWRMPAEHLALAEAMCYDGTPHWQQRQWAEQHGWHVREFRVTQENAIALIERGVPFALSTVDSTSAHMMAVVGFDRVRNTLLLRDPGEPYVVEHEASLFLERYRAFGPHGTVFLPEGESGRLDGLCLADSAAYDLCHAICLALVAHQRSRAEEVLGQLETAFGGHAVTWEARLHLAVYDANSEVQVHCLDELLKRFPGNPARLLQRLGCLCTATREERVAFMERACSGKNPDPALLVELARCLEGDARALPGARSALARALRRRPLDSAAIRVLGDLDWEEGRLEEATDLYRVAATVEGFSEHLYRTWFGACRSTRRTEEALAQLQERWHRLGNRSEQPALTLAWAWREVTQPGRAREVLSEAALRRPDDGIVLLRLASLVAGLGDYSEAQSRLEAARGKTRPNDWLRTATEIAEARLETPEALRLLRELAELEPLALDVHAGLARALDCLEGPAAALAHLRATCERFPHHYGLRRMVVEWGHADDVESAVQAARELLLLAPSDAWVRRELSLFLLRAKRTDEALAEALEAARIEPRNSTSFSVLGHVYRMREQADAALANFRRAVELSVDNVEAMRALLDFAPADDERKAELEFVERQLIQQVVSGEGVLAFQELAWPILDPEALLSRLRQAHAERPDLWHVWSALVSQLGQTNRLDEACEIAKGAAARFSHLPRAWLDVALVHQWRNEPAAETAAAERAFEINPAWTRSALSLADILERQGRFEESLQVYERALQHVPNDAQLQACRANLLWRQRQPAAAFVAVEHALRLAPAYEWAWSLLQAWATDSGEAERPADLARALTRERSGDPRVWLLTARVLTQPETLPERLAAVEKALELSPRSTEAWDLKAEILATCERFDEALGCCRQGEAANSEDAYRLRGRSAWIEAQRLNVAEAVHLMRDVLAENAGYVWGWQQLARWLVEQGTPAEAAWALEQLHRLHPHDAWVNRQLGFLRVEQEDEVGAQKAFEETLRLEPTDASAAQNLFDLRLRANDLEGAARTLGLMKTHQPGAVTLAAEALLLLKRKDRRAALALLESLCASPDPDAWPVSAVAEGFEQAGWSGSALRVLKRALKAGACNPQVATAAVRLLLARKKTLAAARVFLRLSTGEPQSRVAAPLVEGLAKLKSELTLRWLLWKRRDALSRDDAAWGQVGYALIQFNRMNAVARWLADWRARPNVQPWVLFNLCLALRYQGRYDEAYEVARHVVETWGHREGSADLRLFLAVEEALRGALSEAAEHVRRVKIREMVKHDQALLALAKTLVAFQQSSPDERSVRFGDVRRALREPFSVGQMPFMMKDLRRTFRRAGALFAREGAGWRAQCWFGWRLHWQWLLLPLFPVAVATHVLPILVVILLVMRWVSRSDSK